MTKRRKVTMNTIRFGKIIVDDISLKPQVDERMFQEFKRLEKRPQSTYHGGIGVPALESIGVDILVRSSTTAKPKYERGWVIADLVDSTTKQPIEGGSEIYNQVGNNSAADIIDRILIKSLPVIINKLKK
jgi:hypothetical protein